MQYKNGRIPKSELAYIGNGHYMIKPAARAFNQMNEVIKKKYGRGIGVVSSYRPYDKQVYFWRLFLSGRGNLAARPGSSNHGAGLAIDVDKWSEGVIEKHGAPYGFQKKWSDAYGNGPGTRGYESWHIKYSDQNYNPPKVESIYKYLTKEEKDNVLKLRYARSQAKKAGGWSKVPDQLKNAVEAKNELRDRIKVLKELDLNKLNRRKRLNVLTKVVEDE